MRRGAPAQPHRLPTAGHCSGPGAPKHPGAGAPIPAARPGRAGSAGILSGRIPHEPAGDRRGSPSRPPSKRFPSFPPTPSVSPHRPRPDRDPELHPPPPAGAARQAPRGARAARLSARRSGATCAPRRRRRLSSWPPPWPPPAGTPSSPACRRPSPAMGPSYRTIQPYRIVLITCHTRPLATRRRPPPSDGESDARRRTPAPPNFPHPPPSSQNRHPHGLRRTRADIPPRRASLARGGGGR